jgi:N-carbamoyl-L-amino-acid hydrolase
MGALKLLAEIADIGRNPVTGGYRRFAFTREDAQLAEWFTAACESRGLDVTRDRAGNQWAWWGDPDASTRSGAATGQCVVTGSHLDSVPDGGAYDGPLGVVSALAAIDVLRERGVQPGGPLGVVRFVDEEGARFGLACSGSRLMTGAAQPDDVLGLRDAQGIAYADAMRSAGLDPSTAGRDDEALARVGAFVELHIEQGRALATPDHDAPVGVATRIRPHGRWRVDLAGRADHAGTTLLADRADPMLDLARLITTTRVLAETAQALATIGRVDVRPNAVNAIPSSVTAWLDARADDPEQVERVTDGLRAAGFEPQRESWTPATDFDAALARRVADVVHRSAGTALPLATGAGHDAGVMAQAGVPTAMLFVRNPTGASHTPAEHADDADVAVGVQALADVLEALTVKDQPSHD